MIDQDINHASLRNLLELSKPYVESAADSILHFPDTARVAGIDEFGNDNAPGFNQARHAPIFCDANEVSAFMAIDFMKPREWSYLSEQIESTISRVVSSSLRIIPGVTKPC